MEVLVGGQVGDLDLEQVVEITADPDGTVWVGGAAASCIRGNITI